MPVADSTRPEKNPLSRLFWLRNFTLLGLLVLMLWSEFGAGVKLPWPAMGGTLLLLASLNAFTALRLRMASPAHAGEIFMHLLIDLAGLTVLLLYSGGWVNPFVSLLLLPVVVAALLLPTRLAWLTGGLAIAAYSLLAYINIPLVMAPEKAFYLHVSGMWFNFAASVLVVVLMVLKLRTRLLDRERELAAAREATLRNEQVVAVALTAASAAHDLGTPLNTLTLLNENLLHSARDDQREDLELMRTQIERCRSLLKNLSRTAQNAKATIALPGDQYLLQLVEEWRLLRPAVEVDTVWRAASIPQMAPPASLNQALINLLNNAADAAPGRVRIEGSSDNDTLRLDILDAGTGPAAALIAKPGHSSKGGLGLGLFLSNASIEALGGQVSLRERAGGGSCVSVQIPLSHLQTRGVQT